MHLRMLKPSSAMMASWGDTTPACKLAAAARCVNTEMRDFGVRGADGGKRARHRTTATRPRPAYHEHKRAQPCSTAGVSALRTRGEKSGPSIAEQSVHKPAVNRCSKAPAVGRGRGGALMGARYGLC
jgi:hypothetical protein